MTLRARTAALVLILLLSAAAPVAAGASAQSGVEFTHEGETLTLAAGPGQAIYGTADLPAGTALSVRLRSTNESRSPFLRAAETVVDQHGKFRAVVDLTDVRPGTTFEAVVHRDGRRLANTTGKVVACDACGDSNDTTTEADPWTSDSLAVKSTVAVDQGATARIPVALGDADAATLSVGGDRVNYRVNATVRDGNSDGRADVLFNTSAAGHDHPTLRAADDADELTVRHESRLDARQLVLDASEYPIRLYRGARTGGDEADAGTLDVREADVREHDYDRTTAAGSAGSAGFDFEDRIVRATRGQTTKLSVTLGDADAATLSIGGTDADYRVNATVRDGNGDGRVDVLFDTSAVGDEGATVLTAADGADEVTVTATAGSQADAADALAPGNYDLGLHRGAAADGDADAIGTLVVDEADPTSAAGSADRSPDGDVPLRTSGIGALVAGGVVAVAGVGLLLGVRQS